MHCLSASAGLSVGRRLVSRLRSRSFQGPTIVLKDPGDLMLKLFELDLHWERVCVVYWYSIP